MAEGHLWGTPQPCNVVRHGMTVILTPAPWSGGHWLGYLPLLGLLRHVHLIEGGDMGRWVGMQGVVGKECLWVGRGSGCNADDVCFERWYSR